MRELFDVCFQRKSVRTFANEPLSDETLAEIMEFTKNAEALNPRIPHEFELLENKAVKGLFSIKAPYYLCLYEEAMPGHVTNGGYLMEQVDLYLASRGIGACWLGMAKPPKELLQRKPGMDFVVMLAFGKPADPNSSQRKSTSEFKRKPLEEIAQSTLLADPRSKRLLELARLAPSATNGQPWYFSGTFERLEVNRIKLPPIKATLFEKMNQLDVGIVLCFLKQAAMNSGLELEILFRNRPAPKGCLAAAEVRPSQKKDER